MITIGMAGNFDLCPSIKENAPLWDYLYTSTEHRSLAKSAWLKNKTRPDIFYAYNAKHFLNGVDSEWPHWNVCKIVEGDAVLHFTFASAVSTRYDIPLRLLEVLRPYINPTVYPVMISGYKDNSKVTVFRIVNDRIISDFEPIAKLQCGRRDQCQYIDPLLLSFLNPPTLSTLFHQLNLGI